MDVREKLVELLAKYFDVGDSYAYNLTRVKSAFACGTMGFDDFEEFDEETVADIADYLISNGVMVQELDGCKYCKEYEDLPEHFIDGKPIGRVFDTCIQPNENGLWHIEVPCGADIGIRFCPMCGRRLLQPNGERKEGVN